MLTIAHRLETIADYDLVAVLDRYLISLFPIISSLDRLSRRCSLCNHLSSSYCIALYCIVLCCIDILLCLCCSGKVVEYGSPYYLLTCPPDQFESTDETTRESNQMNSTIRSRGLFLDLVNGLGLQRKAAIVKVAKDRSQIVE